MHTQITSISPAYALELLKGNTDNRNVRKRYVGQLASAMLNGEWKLSPQPIIIGKDGRLLDGQHRLMAVESSGTTQPFMVTSGADNSIFDVIDIGAKRDYSDISGLSRPVAQVITCLAVIYYSSNKPTPQQIHKIADIYGVLVKELNDRVTAKPKIIGSAAMRASAVYMAKKTGLIGYIFGQYESLAKLDYKNLEPVCESFNRIVQRNSGKTSQPFSKYDLFKYGVKIFNYDNRVKLRASQEKAAIEDYRDFTSKLI